MSAKTTKPSPPRRFASLQGAATYCDCSVKTIRRRIASGDIRAYRIPGSRLLRVDLDELDAALRPIPTAQALA